ncbi:MAG: tetratricopeptide repeat protein, partial [Verrucomicrobiota bacterium]
MKKQMFRFAFALLLMAPTTRSDDVDKLVLVHEEALKPVAQQANSLTLVPTNPRDRGGLNLEGLRMSPLERGFELLKQSHHQEAESAFDELLKANPKHAEARFGKVTALTKQERYEEALAILIPMSDEFADNFLVKNKLAWLYATARDPAFRNGKKSLAIAQEALLLKGTSFHVWSTLSEAYFICGEYDRALRSAEQATKLARLNELSDFDMTTYTDQVKKCRSALDAHTFLE